MTDIKSTWMFVMKPVVDKLKLSTTLNMNTVFNPDGSDALAKLIVKMAEHIDKVNAMEESE